MIERSAEASWPVMVLAHNEADHIVPCLDSLYAAEPGRDLEVFVLANGCTDATEPIVERYARTHPGVHVVSIALADKCNAWNVFVHETIPARIPGRDVYFFMDGDARVSRGSLSAMAEALQREPAASAASAIPVTGRSRIADARTILEARGLVANLYALSAPFVQALQAKSVRLPLGLEGDDGLLGALIKWDLEPRGRWDDTRIVPCADAGFAFESLSPTRARDWRAYWRRRIRYARRFYEFELLGPRLKAHGLAAMPVHIREIYGHATSCRVRKHLWTVFDWLALREMRKQAVPASESAR